MGQIGQLMYPGQSNTYVKDHAATNFLITQFSRNVKDFPLNQYIQYLPVKKDTGYYLRLNIEQAGRLKDGKLDKHVWPDGADRPEHNDGTSAFNWVDFRAIRFNYGCTLGWLSRDQAGYNIQDVELANKAQLAMTARTKRVHEVLANNSLWDSTHVTDVTTISGNTGRWDQSTTGRADIKRSLGYAHNIIRLHTLAVVKKKKDMQLVMNPTTARKVAECQEIINAVIQSRFAMSHMTNDESQFDEYGLPSKLYGFKVVIEDTVMVSSPIGASTVTYQDVCPDGVVYLLSRPGGLVARSANNGVNYSTVMSFMKEDMTTEAKDDPDNRRSKINVVDHTAEELTAPVSGFKFENVV